MADPTPIPAEALEVAISATGRHYTAEFDGVIPVCRCGSREDDHEARVIVAAVAPILLAAGRTAAAEDIRATFEARHHPMSVDRLVGERAARIAENGADQ